MNELDDMARMVIPFALQHPMYRKGMGAALGGVDPRLLDARIARLTIVDASSRAYTENRDSRETDRDHDHG